MPLRLMHPSPPESSRKRNVLIYRTDLLRFSETFIPAQAEQLTHFVPFYSGLRREAGITLPEGRVIFPSASPRVIGLRDRATILGIPDPWFEREVREIEPALIHAHFEDGGLRCTSLAQRLRVPLFVTCHGFDVTVKDYLWKGRFFLGDFYQKRRRDLFKRASVCLGVSDFICDQMFSRGYPKAKIRKHYIGVDTEHFRPDPTVAKQPQIAFVGRLAQKKGVADLLEAMNKVNAKFPEVRLKIIGDGPLRAQLESVAQNNGLNVEFCGVQSPAVIQEILCASLLLCMPSVRAKNGDSEGLGMVNLEAQATGIPVVGTLHGGIPEAVEDGVTGLLSPEGVPDALADNILALLDNSSLRDGMGLAARERVVRLFDLKRQTTLLEDIYLEILGK